MTIERKTNGKTRWGGIVNRSLEGGFAKTPHLQIEARVREMAVDIVQAPRYPQIYNISKPIELGGLYLAWLAENVETASTSVHRTGPSSADTNQC